jgi:exonuclease VII small subunit
LDSSRKTSFCDHKQHLSENTGVVAILQMITEDIQNEMGQSKKDEATSVKEYQTARKALENTKTALEQAILTLEKSLSAISRATAKLNNHMAALDGKLGANAEGEEAHTTDCGWVKTNFESRRSKRQSERAGLEQAKSFLLGAIEENKLAEEGTSLAVN